MKLSELEVLTLDCQTTGANPQKGHLLEIGWVRTRAASAVNAETLSASAYQLSLPANVDIPPAVQRITGITETDPDRAIAAPEVRQKLTRTAREIAAADQMEKCPMVIHYARFEKPFLKHLCPPQDQTDAFPFVIICTHEITRRLLPGLPRRGLRAVAGYYGHSVPRQRRSGSHAIATAVIWRHLVQQLQAQHDIRSLDQLRDWLNQTTARNRTGRDYPMKPEIRLNLPDKPGIYRMLRSNGDLLYIGKATSLKQRVNSYFRQKGPHAEHTLEMLSQATDLSVTRTGSALEAAVLESDEIKRHCPPYNVALQTGQRKLAYCNKNLQKCAARSDGMFCVGPLPDGNPTAALMAFAAWHKTGDHLHKNAYAILGVSQTYAPETDCLVEGLVLFRQNHSDRLDNHSTLRIITELGRKLWGERLKALENAKTAVSEKTDEEVTEDQDEAPADGPAWTPKTVARGIEHAVMRGALLIRRARWFCLLSESSLAWEARNTGDPHKIILQFEKGAVRSREELPAEKEIPLPAGYARRISDRRKIFDLTIYERLRVVTTELRRLVGEGRKIELHLSPTARLSGRHLTRLLPWV